MWRLYLFLAAVRLYFALSPSYIHPDEHFQGPEVIAGEVFGWPIHKTWEFTSSAPIRSVFPLWLAYGWPLTVLKWIWEGIGQDVPPKVAFSVLRALMFTLSFVLEDWALYELLPLARHRRVAVILVASSYVTWTYQTHTFSNSIETLVVLWSLVLIGRIRDSKKHTEATACIILAFFGVLGIFNRITFPAFLVIPAVQLVPHLLTKPLRIVFLSLSALTTAFFAIWTDTEFYTHSIFRFRDLLAHAVLTPLNNFLYNFDPANLTKHGLHPFWQHLGANLPQLLGPAFPLIIFSCRRGTFFWSAVGGMAVLSCFQHQEARFLMPAVPLILASVKIPRRFSRLWIASWVSFNVLAGIFFGIYHQGGVAPAQIWLSRQEIVGQVFWWKTYSPPRWLLDGKSVDIATVDLMGIPGPQMIDTLKATSACDALNQTLLVAPSSATFLDPYTSDDGDSEAEKAGLHFTELWGYRQHLNLDDMDFDEDGILPTVSRVVGRRGLSVWKVVPQNCHS